MCSWSKAKSVCTYPSILAHTLQQVPLSRHKLNFLSTSQTLRFLPACVLWECWNRPVPQPRTTATSTSSAGRGGARGGKGGVEATQTSTEPNPRHATSRSSRCKWLKWAREHTRSHTHKICTTEHCHHYWYWYFSPGCVKVLKVKICEQVRDIHITPELLYLHEYDLV